MLLIDNAAWPSEGKQTASQVEKTTYLYHIELTIPIASLRANALFLSAEAFHIPPKCSLWS